MATINYYFRGINTGTITVRFSHTRQIDLKFATHITIPKKSWDKKKQRVKNIGEMKVAGKINEKLIELESHLLSSFNLSHIGGEDIDSKWLRKAVLKFFSRPSHEWSEQKDVAGKLYLVDFAEKFIKETMKTGKWKDARSKKPVKENIIGQYERAIDKVKDFEKANRHRVQLRKIDLDFCEDFCEYMIEKEYGLNTINRDIIRIKFFCTRAEELNLEVNKIYKSPNFSSPTEETHDPYLNEQEIDAVCNLNIKEEYLDNIRDWFAIGLHTGLRISDILGDSNWPALNQEHIITIEGERYIQRKTKKTKEIVTIPLRQRVLDVLNKRNGEFPEPVSHKHFNEKIKDVCREAEITEEIWTSVNDPVKNRKVKGYRPKCDAVSSHICRRSFATNNLDKMPRSFIMKIGGWRTESAFLRYLKKSGTEYAEQVSEIWKKEDLKTNK